MFSPWGLSCTIGVLDHIFPEREPLPHGKYIQKLWMKDLYSVA